MSRESFLIFGLPGSWQGRRGAIQAVEGFELSIVIAGESGQKQTPEPLCSGAAENN